MSAESLVGWNLLLEPDNMARDCDATTGPISSSVPIITVLLSTLTLAMFMSPPLSLCSVIHCISGGSANYLAEPNIFSVMSTHFETCLYHTNILRSLPITFQVWASCLIVDFPLENLPYLTRQHYLCYTFDLPA